MAIPLHSSVSAFAPATVANLGPGFDILGLALEGPGDTVIAKRVPEPGVQLVEIEGDGGVLPRDPAKNSAGVAAAATMALAGVEMGVELTLQKGLPVGSGMGSSAASAAAAAMATNALLGSPLRKRDLIGPCLDAEETVSGRHADNIAPALLGGLILVCSLEPLDILRLPIPTEIRVVVVRPDFELQTKHAREALPKEVSLASMVTNAAKVGALVSACYTNDLALFGRYAMDDVIAPRRSALIPGCQAAIDAALGAGALGASVSGSGPSVFALTRSDRTAVETGRVMQAAFLAAGLDSTTFISPADCPGARRL